MHPCCRIAAAAEVYAADSGSRWETQLRPEMLKGSCSCPAGEYVCFACAKVRAHSKVEVDCSATLIVSPAQILEQWRTEIAKHTHEGVPLAA